MANNNDNDNFFLEDIDDDDNLGNFSLDDGPSFDAFDDDADIEISDTEGGPSRAFIIIGILLSFFFVIIVAIVAALLIGGDEGECDENCQLATEIASTNSAIETSIVASETAISIQSTAEEGTRVAVAATNTQISIEAETATQDAVDAAIAATETQQSVNATATQAREFENQTATAIAMTPTITPTPELVERLDGNLTDPLNGEPAVGVNLCLFLDDGDGEFNPSADTPPNCLPAGGIVNVSSAIGSGGAGTGGTSITPTPTATATEDEDDDPTATFTRQPGGEASPTTTTETDDDDPTATHTATSPPLRDASATATSTSDEPDDDPTATFTRAAPNFTPTSDGGNSGAPPFPPTPTPESLGANLQPLGRLIANNPVGGAVAPAQEGDPAEQGPPTPTAETLGDDGEIEAAASNTPTATATTAPTETTEPTETTAPSETPTPAGPDDENTEGIPQSETNTDTPTPTSAPLTGNDQLVGQTRTDENGNFVLENLPLGTYFITIGDESLPIEVRDEAYTLEVPLGDGETISLLVEGAARGGETPTPTPTIAVVQVDSPTPGDPGVGGGDITPTPTEDALPTTGLFDGEGDDVSGTDLLILMIAGGLLMGFVLVVRQLRTAM